MVYLLADKQHVGIRHLCLKFRPALRAPGLH